MSVPERRGTWIIAAGGCSRVAGIDMDDRGPVLLLCPQDPLEGDGVVLRGVAPHDQDAIAVLQIDVVVRHRTAPERLSQSRYGGAVSDPGLVVDVDQPHRPARNAHQPALLVVHVGAAEMADRLAAVDELTLGVAWRQSPCRGCLSRDGRSARGPSPSSSLPTGRSWGPGRGPCEAGTCWPR